MRTAWSVLALVLAVLVGFFIGQVAHESDHADRAITGRRDLPSPGHAPLDSPTMDSILRTLESMDARLEALERRETTIALHPGGASQAGGGDADEPTASLVALRQATLARLDKWITNRERELAAPIADIADDNVRTHVQRARTLQQRELDEARGVRSAIESARSTDELRDAAGKAPKTAKVLDATGE